MKHLLYLVCFLLSFNKYAHSQSAADKYREAVKLKNESRFTESLVLFKDLVKSDSLNLDYLCNASYLFSKTGNNFADENSRKNYFNTARYLSQKAIAINPDFAAAHYTYALSLGRLNENASNKEKLANAKLIKSECDRALQLDPKNANVYHILGRWHRTIAGFGTFEKLAINTMFGGMPQGGSYENAIDCFLKSVQLDPGFILHYYELALSYHERGKKGDDIYAKVWLQKALQLPKNPSDPDDANTRKKCEELLLKVS